MSTELLIISAILSVLFILVVFVINTCRRAYLAQFSADIISTQPNSSVPIALAIPLPTTNPSSRTTSAAAAGVDDDSNGPRRDRDDVGDDNEPLKRQHTE